MGKEKNSGYRHCFYFPTLFSKAFCTAAVARSVEDLRKGGRWFDPQLGQYTFQGLMIVIATGLFPLSLLAMVSTIVTWESSQWLGKNVLRSTG